MPYLHDLEYDIFVIDHEEEFEGAFGTRWLRPSEYTHPLPQRLIDADTSTHINATRSGTIRRQFLSQYNTDDGEEKSIGRHHHHDIRHHDHHDHEAAGADVGAGASRHQWLASPLRSDARARILRPASAGQAQPEAGALLGAGDLKWGRGGTLSVSWSPPPAGG
eukprot:gene1722-726_t